MAKRVKKEPTLDDAVEKFRDVIRRANVSEFRYTNRIMYTSNPKGVNMLIVPEPLLFQVIKEDPEIGPRMKELLPGPDYESLRWIFPYGENLTGPGWVEIPNEKFFPVNTMELQISWLPYTIPINKGLIPVRLRKSEMNGVSYQVYVKQKVLSLQKHFDNVLPDTAYSFIRIFKILGKGIE